MKSGLFQGSVLGPLLFSLFKQIHSFSVVNSLSVNPATIQCILIGPLALLSTVNHHVISETVFNNNNNITLSNNVKSLGVIIDKSLSWAAHFTTLYRNVYHSLHYVNRLKILLPARIKQV
ncbi:hypothetical protein PR048_024225 [Dryococelus australis]|uniref:Reverse transcriptase domain-containing protein n=1 Tax=Dryococelus australis TaxID=614101 RepID=A0ABQ9GN09_9NEOP|nr:hypothetical protein PR048_024225 [Dryococelus australis]